MVGTVCRSALAGGQHTVILREVPSLFYSLFVHRCQRKTEVGKIIISSFASEAMNFEILTILTFFSVCIEQC